MAIRSRRPDASPRVGSHGGARVDLRRFLVAGNAMAGAQLAVGADPVEGFFAEGGLADLHEGLVAGNPVGANVQTEGFDLARLADRVLYRDNGRDLDAERLPVPEAGTPLR